MEYVCLDARDTLLSNQELPVDLPALTSSFELPCSPSKTPILAVTKCFLWDKKIHKTSNSMGF